MKTLLLILIIIALLMRLIIWIARKGLRLFSIIKATKMLSKLPLTLMSFISIFTGHAINTYLFIENTLLIFGYVTVIYYILENYDILMEIVRDLLIYLKNKFKQA